MPRQPPPDLPVYRAGILWGGIPSRSDGPDRLVRQHHLLHLGGAESLEGSRELSSHDGQGVPRLPFLQLLTHAQHGDQPGGKCGPDFPGGLGIGLSEDLPAFRVSDQGRPRTRLRNDSRRQRAGEGALRLPVDVLRADPDVGPALQRMGDRFERRSGRKEPDLTSGDWRRFGEKGRAVGSGISRPEVHFPVCREEQSSHASSRATTPGRGFPSRNSSDAPPPVETCESLSSSPATAAAESPPPTMVTAPLAPASTSAFATARVPTSNGGVSKTPIGPFHKIVLALRIRARKSAAVAWSMSKTAQPAGMASEATLVRSPDRSREGAITAPRGRISFFPALVRRAFARSIRSRSTREVPTSNPIAAKNVHAIAPPISTSSTRGRSDSITSILPEILAPPSTATKGRLGAASASPRYLSSFCIRNPATAGLRMCATASVELCARCADPNASST